MTKLVSYIIRLTIEDRQSPDIYASEVALAVQQMTIERPIVRRDLGPGGRGIDTIRDSIPRKVPNAFRVDDASVDQPLEIQGRTKAAIQSVMDHREFVLNQNRPAAHGPIKRWSDLHDVERAGWFVDYIRVLHDEIANRGSKIAALESLPPAREESGDPRNLRRRLLQLLADTEGDA